MSDNHCNCHEHHDEASQKSIYDQAFEKFNLQLSDEKVSEAVHRLVAENKEKYNTPEVKRQLLSTVELTTLKVTDSAESVLKFTENVNRFADEHPELPHLATICVYPNFAKVVSQTLEVDGVEVACVSGGFPSSQTFIEIKTTETALAIHDGATEIDCVLSVGAFLSGDYETCADEIEEIISKTKYDYFEIEFQDMNKNDDVVNTYITNLREKYMGDIIDISLSKGKPIQILPHTNFCNKRNEKYNFIKNANLLHFLNEIIIHLDHILDQDKLIDYLQSMPDNITYSISGDLKHIAKFDKLVDFLNQYNSSKKIICNYINFAIPASVCKNIFLYKIHIHFPIDIKQLIITTQSLKDQNNLFELIFDIASLDDYLKAWEIIEEYQIDKYQFNPIYTGYNIDFFKENVFLKKSDILSTSMSIKDFFIKQMINNNDFGKINIMPNGDVHSNINYPALGNICTHSIFELIQKEIEEGKSWLRVRNQEPCNACIYQWLCPSPSDYEIMIGQTNLCHVNIHNPNCENL